MNSERFNELVNGLISHPLPMFMITRLTLALKAVVDECKEDGERALEAYCAARQEKDERP
jgi:hypothetical protein